MKPWVGERNEHRSMAYDDESELGRKRRQVDLMALKIHSIYYVPSSIIDLFKYFY